MTTYHQPKWIRYSHDDFMSVYNQLLKMLTSDHALCLQIPSLWPNGSYPVLSHFGHVLRCLAMQIFQNRLGDVA